MKLDKSFGIEGLLSLADTEKQQTINHPQKSSINLIASKILKNIGFLSYGMGIDL